MKKLIPQSIFPKKSTKLPTTEYQRLYKTVPPPLPRQFANSVLNTKTGKFEKEDPFHIRWTIGGNLIIKNGDVYTPNTDMVTSKVLLDNVVSTPKTKILER